jgi:hypothetical protein
MITLSRVGILLAVSLGLLATLRAGEGGSPAKEALQELNDYIGGWKGTGTSEKDKRLIWKETMDWTWRFQKGKEPTLVFTIDKGRYFKKGEIRYLPARKVYELTLEDVSGKGRVFEGAFAKKKLFLERKDTDHKEKQKLELYLPGDGGRLVYTYWVKPEDRTLYGREFQVGYSRPDETVVAGGKKVECIVTGGLGTIPVMYKGVTYYVCCSGCRDAFLESPEQYVREFNAKKKGGK